jgi:hypothetical protein
MSNITAVAKQFFEACEAGRGWDVCWGVLHAKRELLGTSRTPGRHSNSWGIC